MKNICLVLILAAAPAPLPAAEPAAADLVPAAIPYNRPAQPELTAELRSRVRTLGLNGLKTSSGTISRALLLLPEDRTRPGVMNFELQRGKQAGVYQCEALGRGVTSTSPAAGWLGGVIGGTTVYYLPQDQTNGATVPGVYDLRNISPETYEIELLGRGVTPETAAEILGRDYDPAAKKKYFSAAFRDWFPAGTGVLAVDMMWAEGWQAGTQGEGIPFFERRPEPSSEASKARQARQLSHNPRYYFGPYGRAGFAVHTDRWEDPARLLSPDAAGRPEPADFRWRDTDGCVKLRPGCLKLFNAFVAEQEQAGRRVQLEIRLTNPPD
ncbi:MAG: hypothetical protein NDI60_05150 [Elusimicrobiales bacterium]|nr:hypothetical protein [Elusimicrobiales bacterium]